MQLTDLPRGKRALIRKIDAGDNLARKFLELGIQEGMEVGLLHTGPIRRDPIAIAMNDRCIALRRRDASHILVDIVD